MENFDFKRILGYFFSKLYILILALILVVSLGEIYTFRFQTPMFASSTRMVLTNEVESAAGITQNDVTLVNNLVKTYAEIVKGHGVLSQVIEELNLPMSVEQLSGKITVSTAASTQLITIRVVDEDGERAKEIANKVAKVFKKETARIYKIDNVQIEYEATVSNVPYNINVAKQTVYYIIGGLMLGAGVILLMMYLDNTIKDSKMVEERIGLMVLGVVPRVEKK